MKVRLHGTRAEIAEATLRLAQVLDVVSMSDPYPDRGASVLVRVYLDVRLDPAGSTRSTGVAPEGSPDPSEPPAPTGWQQRREVAGR